MRVIVAASGDRRTVVFAVVFHQREAFAAQHQHAEAGAAGLQETPVVQAVVQVDGGEAGRAGARVRVYLQHVALPLHGPGQDGFHEVGGWRDTDARMIDEIAFPGDV